MPEVMTGQPSEVILTRLDEVRNWGRKNSLWPLPIGISCCAIEMMGMLAPKFDVSRFGAEVLRFSPRQSDLMIVAGTLTYKMANAVRQLYEQMPEPKWVVAMGTCLCTGGMFDSYPVVQGLDKVVPVDIYVPGCPPRPEGLIYAIQKIQDKVSKSNGQGLVEKLPPKDESIKVPLPGLRQIEPREGDNIMILNMGPSHPATHGVLRLILELDGERVLRCIPDLGYLHRGFEKLAENRTHTQFVTYTDRLDYLAPLSNNVAYILAVEKLLGVEAPPRAQYIRTICCELARISAHLLGIGTHLLDLGALSVFFLTFRDREELYTIFEKITGTRMTTSYTRAGGVERDLTPEAEALIRKFLAEFPAKIDELDRLVTGNKVFLERARDVGVISKEEAVAYSLTGPNLRGSGVPYDLRRAKPYLVYNDLDFEVPIAYEGDAFSRYLVRVEEMRQSLQIVRQCLEKLPQGEYMADIPNVTLPKRDRVYAEMEALIHHFKIASEGYHGPEGIEVYHGIENPKGELGFGIIGSGGAIPYRLRIRSPSYINLQILPKMVEGRLLSDVITCIGSLDIVLGEIDR
ncbi:MAG: NADH dehydrogenase (quinone) subunit D [Nitrospirae bacterium]|nr:NADH dehydrogenase (quinone) subunit D [Nitrospirota bacterium]